MPDTALLDVDTVSRSFGPVAAVRDMSLTVRPGEIVGLLGANGAGKTTLIRMILGLVRADQGEIQVFGERPSPKALARLGYLPQNLGLYHDLTVSQNASFVAAAFGVRNPPPLPPALEEVRDRPVGEIGLGRQRQLAFHCTLLHSPELLVLDEPTSGVDPLARARLWDTIHAERERGVGVLVTTHYMEEAEQCSRLAIMSQGRLIAEGDVATITGSTPVVAVEAHTWSEAFTALVAAGLPVSLAGRNVRVAGVPADNVNEVLDRAGIDATVRTVPATLEETMLLIEQGGPRSR